MSPVERSLKFLRQAGYHAAVTEKLNSHVLRKGKKGRGIRQDLFGFMDIYSFNPRLRENLAVQATTRGYLISRKNKVLENFHAIAFLRIPGNRIEIDGWAKRKPRGQKKVFYELVREEIRM